MKFAEIILPLSLQGSFTYKIPEELCTQLEKGMRVLVSFGGKKIYTGIVFDLHDVDPVQFVPKEILSVLDDFPIIQEQHLSFWKWLSDYYLCNLGDIYRFAFPSSLKLESETYLKLKPNVEINFENLDVHEMYLIQALEVRQLINLSSIEAFIPKKEIIKTINSLIDLQYIEIDEKISEKYKSKEVSYVRINRTYYCNERLPEILLQLKRSPKQQELLLLVLEMETEDATRKIRKSELLSDGRFGSSQLKALVEKHLLEEYVQSEDRLQTYQGEVEELDQLSEDQIQACMKIDEAFNDGKNVLLHGVTSSGKTHVYLEKIEETLAKGKNVLFMLPEIALTKQISRRLEKKYGAQLGFYHQKLTDFEKVEVWRKVSKNELKIIIGTRNALFLPFRELGLVVVDEEHDSMYKPREVVPFYNAKDAVQVLAKLFDAHVVLGSATPSVESYYLAQTGKIQYIYLGERYGNVDLPKFFLINFKEEQERKTLQGNFSNELLEVLKNNLEQKKQAMILHNRRGYANVVECENCGHVTYCANCDVVMTYHKYSNELKCHYCGQKGAKPEKCPKCLSDKLNTKGVGVEKIYEELRILLPNADIDRMDVDSMRKKFAYERLYEKIENNETDIIVGTQMISKGLDFENIEIVAIPRGDQMLYTQDFRAEERAYQLITQVSGRAGRISGKGAVYIQTFNPDHVVFRLIKDQDPSKIYAYFLEERKKFHYPPFTKLILVELKHRKPEKVQRAAQFLGSIFRKYLKEDYIFGPEKSPISRINTLYQYQILLKLPRGKNYKYYKNLVAKSFDELDEISAYKSIKKHIYVDF